MLARDAAGVVLEQGPAVAADGGWTYAATVPVATGETVTIEATAKDQPGHTGSKVLPWTVA